MKIIERYKRILKLSQSENHQMSTEINSDMSFLVSRTIQKCRQSLGLSQSSFARFFHVTQATIARWEYEENPISIPKNYEEILHKIISICENRRLKKTFINILNDPDGFEICSAIFNLIELDPTGGNLSLEQVRVKEKSFKSLQNFLEKVEMKDTTQHRAHNFLTDASEDDDWELMTHGHIIPFNFFYDGTSKILTIRTARGRTDCFNLYFISKVLVSLYEKFETDNFPLANSVDKIPKGKERIGLGSTIYKLNGGDIKNAQAASYLGPLIESLGILKWNGRSRGIEWRFCRDVPSDEELECLIVGALKYKEGGLNQSFGG